MKLKEVFEYMKSNKIKGRYNIAELDNGDLDIEILGWNIQFYSKGNQLPKIELILVSQAKGFYVNTSHNFTMKNENRIHDILNKKLEFITNPDLKNFSIGFRYEWRDHWIL